MIATLSALVLGLLVSSAKNNFDTTSAEITQGAAKAIELDRTLANYGPETKDAPVNYCAVAWSPASRRSGPKTKQWRRE